MGKKEEILILFDGPHLAYSPTVTQLVDALSADFSVTILAEKEKGFIDQELSGYSVQYYRVIRRKPTFIFKLWYFLLSLKEKEVQFLRSKKIKFPEYQYRFRFIKKWLQGKKYRRVIAVDIKNLFYCTVLNVPADLLSLELGQAEQLLPLIDKQLIRTVIIQTPERYNYLFQDAVIRTFYIQNAPIYRELTAPAYKKGLLYGGTAWDPFGFYHCLEYLKAYPDETLTVQGALPPAEEKRINAEYKELLTSNRLIISRQYIENEKVVDHFAQFEIGFCFYNFNIPWVDHFNYRSAPSGKLFKYLAAGVPVVAVDISGFAFVNEYKCGVLISDLSPRSIREAITRIREHYAEYAANARAAAKRFSFDKMVAPYVEWVKEDK